MPNRITTYADMVAEKLKDVPEPTQATVEQTAALSFADHFAYQNAQSEAFTMGKITLEESQTVYIALGEAMSETNGGWKAHVDLPLKVAITTLIGELLGVEA